MSDAAEASLCAEAASNNTSLLRFGVFVFGMNSLRTKLTVVAGNAKIAQMTNTPHGLSVLDGKVCEERRQ